MYMNIFRKELLQHIHWYGWSVFRFKSITFLPIIDFKIRQMEVSLRRRRSFSMTKRFPKRNMNTSSKKSCPYVKDYA